MQIVLFPHTHWDREWYKPFQAFRIRLVDVIEQLIEDLEKEKLEYFYLDGQTIVLEDYFEIYPEKQAIIKNFIRDKRLYIGPWYVLADEFLVSGESLIRNMLVGIRQAKSLGCNDFIGYMPDSFGHNSEIPKILTSFNIKNAVLWRGAGNNKSEFIWQSYDGSSILTTYLTEGYFVTENFDEYIEKIKKYSVSDKILLPVGGDHIYSRSAMQTLQGTSRINKYFDNLEKFIPKMKTVKGELRDNSRNPILPGTLSTRQYLKQHNAISTWKLSRITEPLQAFLKFNRKNELDYAWKLLLKNHPHDSICGCSIDEVHEENVSRYKQVNQICDALIERSLSQIIKDENKDYITICNMSNYPFTGVVKINQNVFPRNILLDTQRAPMSEDIQEAREYLAYVENIPPFSVKSIKPAIPPKTPEITEEIINMQKIISRSDVGDTYNYCPVKEETPAIANLVKSKVIEKSEFRNIVRVYYNLNGTEITTDIITTAGTSRIEFITEWENCFENKIVQVKFDLPEKIRETVSENTFGLIKREFNPDYRLETAMPAEEKQELSTNTAPMQRFVYTQGLGILTEGLPEYEIAGNSLMITILRATGKLSKTYLDTRTFPAGPPLDTPGAQCPGRQRVRYAVCRAEKPEQLFKEADEFMGCTICGFGQAEHREFLNKNNQNILIYGVKFPEKVEGIILRAYNISNKPQHLGLNSKFTETNSLEEPVSEVYNNNDEIIFKPNELKTLWMMKQN